MVKRELTALGEETIGSLAKKLTGQSVVPTLSPELKLSMGKYYLALNTNSDLAEAYLVAGLTSSISDLRRMAYFQLVYMYADRLKKGGSCHPQLKRLFARMMADMPDATATKWARTLVSKYQIDTNE